MTTVKDRLKLFAKSKNLTNQQLEVQAGLSNGYIANMRDSVGKSGLERISNTFPDLNIGWLLTGEGSMLRDERPAQEPPPTTRPSDDGYHAIYKERIAELKQEIVELREGYEKKIAAKYREISELNRKLGAVEAKLGERRLAASLEFSGGLSEVPDAAESAAEISAPIVDLYGSGRPTRK